MKVLFWVALGAALLLGPPARAAFARPVSGVVVEAGTGRPLPGAVVLVRWFRIQADLVHSREVCYHLETAVADGEGKFSTPRWRGNWGFTDPSDIANGMRIQGFKPGYLFGPGAGWSKGKLSLVLFGGTPQEYATRIEELRRLQGDCMGAGDSAANLGPFAAAVAAEAKAYPFVATPSVCRGCATYIPIEPTGTAFREPRSGAASNRDPKRLPASDQAK